MAVVHSEEDDKEQGTNALVAVVKGMIFDDEVEEVGGFFGGSFVEIFAVETLIDGGEAAVEAVVSHFAKEVAGLKVLSEVTNSDFADFWGKDFFSLFVEVFKADVAVVKFF